MKKLLEVLLAVVAAVGAVLGLLVLCEEKSRDEEYLTLYDDCPSDKGN